MASITTATINKRYTVSAKANGAHLAMERLNLVSDATGNGPTADAAIAAFVAEVSGLVGAGTSAVVTTAVKVVAPVTGSFVNGFTATVVNGVITAIVLS